jgi:hypothetical protein
MLACRKGYRGTWSALGKLLAASEPAPITCDAGCASITAICSITSAPISSGSITSSSAVSRLCKIFFFYFCPITRRLICMKSNLLTRLDVIRLRVIECVAFIIKNKRSQGTELAIVRRIRSASSASAGELLK